MNKSFRDYAKSLDMGPQLIAKVEEIHNDFQGILEDSINASKEPFGDIFIAEHLGGNNREYVHLYFFSKDLVFEAENFLKAANPTYAIARLRNIACFRMGKSNFDLLAPPQKESYINATATWEPIPYTMQLLATGANCEKALQMLRKYVLPYLYSHRT